jgi:hypothetical protein
MVVALVVIIMLAAAAAVNLVPGTLEIAGEATMDFPVFLGLGLFKFQTLFFFQPEQVVVLLRLSPLHLFPVLFMVAAAVVLATLVRHLFGVVAAAAATVEPQQVAAHHHLAATAAVVLHLATEPQERNPEVVVVRHAQERLRVLAALAKSLSPSSRHKELT